MQQTILLVSEAATDTLGKSLAAACAPGALIFLQGQLGAGKTTLIRSFLRALGFSGLVKSPTFSVVETYVVDFLGRSLTLHHFDLYRLAHPEELMYLGFEDYCSAEAICLIEWPERAIDLLPPPTLTLQLELTDQLNQRRLQLIAKSKEGEVLMNQLTTQ